MKIIIVTALIILFLVASFVVLGILTYYRNLRKNKYDLLKFIKKNKDKLSITLIENGRITLEHKATKKLPLASTMKIIIAYSFVKEVGKRKLNLNELIEISNLNNYFIEDTDGGAHKKWLNTLSADNEVTLLDVTKGMMHYSSNACTDFLIDKIGVNVINHYIQQLNVDHDPINFITPSMLLPAYISDSITESTRIIKDMPLDRYQDLTKNVFDIMKNDETKSEALKHNLHKNQLLSLETQKALTYRTPKSTTKEYARLMHRLGNELFNAEEKKLFSYLLLGNSIKQNDDKYFWFKGGATPFILTSALYKESKTESLSLSLFIEDKNASDSYWMRTVFNSFVISIVSDIEFRYQLKEII